MAATYRKKKIPKAVREAVWVKHVGRHFEYKCLTHWCPNTMTVFDFQTSHNIPESKGGATELENLYPLCGRCNQSMGSQYTYTDWYNLFKPKSPSMQPPFWKRCYNYVFRKSSAVRPTPDSASSSPPSKTTNPLKFHLDTLQVV